MHNHEAHQDVCEAVWARLGANRAPPCPYALGRGLLVNEGPEILTSRLDRSIRSWRCVVVLASLIMKLRHALRT